MSGTETVAPQLESLGPERSSSARIWAQRALVAAIWLAALVAWRTYQTANDLGTADVAQRFVDGVESAWWGVAAYVGVYLVRPIVLFPASLLTVVGGVLFGPVVGVVVVVVAANASAMIAYGVGRALGRAPGGTAAPSDAELNLAARWSRRMRDNSFETVLVMRLLFLPYDLVNYLSGVLRIRWIPFLTATALGSLPGTVSFVLLGASLERVDEGIGGIDRVALGVSLAIFAASLAGARLLRRRRGIADEGAVA